MATLELNETTNVQVVRFTVEELMTALQSVVIAAGGSWPDFEVGEGDQVQAALTDGAVTVLINHDTVAEQTITLTNREQL